jgi:hypothetical protein
VKSGFHSGHSRCRARAAATLRARRHHPFSLVWSFWAVLDPTFCSLHWTFVVGRTRKNGADFVAGADALVEWQDLRLVTDPHHVV